MSRIPVWSWRDAIRKSSMSMGAKCLCHSISCYLSDAGGYAYPPIEDLMQDTSCSNTSAARYIKEAQAAGFLHVKRMHNDKGHVYGTRYYPAFPSNVELPRAESEKENIPEASTSLHEKSSPRTTRKPCLNENLATLDEDLATLDEESSRHNLQRSFQNNLPPTPKGVSGELLAEPAPATSPTARPRNIRKASAKAAAYTANFEAAWLAFPERHGMSKTKAFASWQQQECEAIASAVIAGVTAYRPWLTNERKRRPDYPVKHMQGWITDRRWEGFQPEQKTSQEVKQEKIRLVALDLVNSGTAKIQALGYGSFERLKRDNPTLFEAALDFACREYGYRARELGVAA